MNINEEKDTRPIMVSIRCTAYNHEKYIRDALEGFVMQKTNFRFEAIVHDDASTDGTAAIIREYAEKYPDIIKPIFEKENQYSKHDGSLGRIMNEACVGKYIAMCEGDDYWTDPYKLQKQVDILEKYKDVIVCCHLYQEYYEDIKSYTSVQPILSDKFCFFDLKYYVSKEKWITQPLTCMYRNDKNVINHYLKYINSKDLSLFFCLLKNGNGYLLHRNMAIYRKHSGGVWTGTSEKGRIMSDYRCIKGIYDIERDDYSAELLLNQFKKSTPVLFYLKNIKKLRPYTNIIIEKYGISYFIKVIIIKTYCSIRKEASHIVKSYIKR